MSDLIINGSAPLGGAWFHEPFSMFQTNLREIDADMDVDLTADFISQHGATAWLQSVGGILANYPTDLDFQIANPYLLNRTSGDLIQDTLDAAKARDIRLLGRMDFSKVQLPVAEAHPEYLYISPNGTWQNHTNNLVSVCPSGDWYQERIFDILDEVMERYELDGFFVNWAGMNENDYYRVYHGVCHCEACQRGWSEYSGGLELPDGPWNETYQEWKLFSDGVINKWTGRVREFIADRNPNAALILGSASDIRFHESNVAVDRDIWHHATTEIVSRFKSSRPEVPVLVNCASFLDHAYRITTAGPEHFVQFHLQAISRGANPSTYIIGVPGKIPWPGMEEAGEIMRFFRKHNDVYAGMRPVAKAGILLPQGAQMNDTQYDESLEEFRGLYKALQELHIPFDVVGQVELPEIAETGMLDRYDVILVPNMGQIKDDDAEFLDSWVAGGGTLIVTGAVGVEDGTTQLQSLPVNSQTEFIDEFQDLWSMYVAPEQDRTEQHYYEGPIVPLIHTYGLYDWKEAAKGLWKKLGFGAFAPPEYIYGNTQVDERAAGIAPYENGTSVLVPFPVGRGYFSTGVSVFRDFFEAIWEEAGTEEAFTFDISSQVEITLNTNRNGQTVIHLMNISGIKYMSFGERLPIPAGSMKLTNGGGEGVAARTLFTNLELEIEEDGTIKLPGIDLFEVIVIEGL